MGSYSSPEYLWHTPGQLPWATVLFGIHQKYALLYITNKSTYTLITKINNFHFKRFGKMLLNLNYP